MDYDLLPPVAYSEAWTLYFLIALGALALYIGGVLIFTRKRYPLIPKYVDRTSDEYRESVRVKHISTIDTVAKLHREGKLDTSALNQQLGVILRAFAAEYSGLRTRPMTLTELRRSREMPKDLVDAIEQFYPVAFRNLSVQGDAEVAVQAAREVLYRWS